MPYKFRGGVHPDYMKAPNEPVVVITPPPQVVIPMAQHIGAPCQPIVKVGDYVTMGQKIGDNPAPVSAPVLILRVFHHVLLSLLGLYFS